MKRRGRWLLLSAVVVGLIASWAIAPACSRAQEPDAVPSEHQEEEIVAPGGPLQAEEVPSAAMGWQFLGGLAGWVVAVIPALPYVICWAGDRPEGRPTCGDDYGPLAWLTTPLAPLTITFGVWGAGQLTGGDGGWGWTFLGQALGGLTSAPVAFLALVCGGGEWNIDCLGLYLLATAMVLVAPVYGGILAYRDWSDPDPATSSREGTVAAGLAPTHDGRGGQLVGLGTW